MITEKTYGKEFELELTDHGWFNGQWNWELISQDIYICSYSKVNGYSTKASAKRAAMRAVKKLGIKLKGQTDE